MSRVLYQCHLDSIKPLTPSIRELTLSIQSPEGFQFKSGQFIMLHFPDREKPEKTVQRAYSIASDHAHPETIRLIIKLYEQGKASDYIRQLTDGQSLQISGPFGRHFFLSPAPPKVRFFCTGAGLSQHMSFLSSHRRELQDKDVRMLMGVWNEQEIFYEKELCSLGGASFKLDYVLDKATPQWKGKSGYITQYFSEMDLNPQDTIIYLCGNPEMIKNAKKILSEQFGFPPEKIVAEAFN